MVPQSVAVIGSQEAAAGRVYIYQAVPAQLDRKVGIGLGNRLRIRLGKECDFLVQSLRRQTRETRPSLTPQTLFYKPLDAVFFCPCYARFYYATPVRTITSQLFQTCTTYPTFSECAFDTIQVCVAVAVCVID